MPLTVKTSCGYSPSSAIACFRACRTPKSPQPGHQSGSAWPLRSLTVSAGRSVISTIISSSLDEDLVRWHVLRGVTGQNRLYTIDNVVRHERFTIVFADMSSSLEACFRAQITSELAAVVVLDNYHALACAQLLEDLLRVQGHEPFDLQVVRDDLMLAGERLHRLANDTLG